MKKALSYKLIILVITFALCMALAFAFVGVKDVSAANITSPSSGFSGGQSITFVDADGDDVDYVKATVKSGDTVSIKNKLVVDDLSVEMNVPETVSEFKVILNYDSYFVNGAFKNDNFYNNIENEFVFETDGDLVVAISTQDNALTVKVGEDVQTKEDIYYMIKGDDKCVAKISFEFTLTEETETADISFISVDQMASDESGAYKQTFNLKTLENGTVAIDTIALPRVAIASSSMVKSGEYFNAIVGKKYTLSFNVYSLFGDVTASSLYLATESADIWLDPSTEKPKSIIFDIEGYQNVFSVRTSDLENKDIEFYTVSSVDHDSEANVAPKYISYEGNEAVYDGYRTLVEKASVKSYTDIDGTSITRSLRLGDSFEIPSLEDLVYDDYDVYSSMTYTVYYTTPSKELSQTTSLKFTVSEAGDYEFFVVFKDTNGNSMEKDDFYTVGDDGIPVYDDCEYKDAIFTFSIEDNAPISVEVPSKVQSKGYLNTKYVATEFKILSGDNKDFTLYYNSDISATEDSDDWIELPILSGISENYDENGFTYADIKTLNYDGEYTFTPVKVGAYMIKCFVSSSTSSSSRYAEGATIIPVEEKPTVVVVPSHWLRDNVWSVVFLSVGTLALIGIIVLLFVKPKQEPETDETGDALKEKAEK